MKVQRYGIYGCLLLICATGMLIGICGSYANSQKPLSFNEMSDVYGGCQQWVAAPNGNGCAGPVYCLVLTGCMELKSSCKQSQTKCAKAQEGRNYCDDMFTECEGTYI